MVGPEPEVWHYWQVGDLGFANELGNYAEYSGAPNEEETLQFARALIDVSLSNCWKMTIWNWEARKPRSTV